MPTSDPANLAATFKAYDVRGTVPDQVDEDLARRVGNAFVTVTGAEAVVVGHDMRPSSPGMSRAFAEGAADAGADVVLIGLASTDQLYFASGSLGLPGAMFTASHNPAQYNGIKTCRAYAVPLGMETGLAEVRDRVANDTYVTAESTGADIGLAFDGDADRCFIVDEQGKAVSPSVITALIAVRELAKHPGATVIYNLITSKAVPEIVAEHGGTAVRTRVGHSFIKATM